MSYTLSFLDSRLYIVNAYYLINPTDKRRDFYIHTGNVYPTATESPRNQTGQLEETVVLAHQRSTTVALIHAQEKINFYVTYLIHNFAILPDKRHCPPRHQRKNWTLAKWRFSQSLRSPCECILCRWRSVVRLHELWGELVRLRNRKINFIYP